MFDFHGDLLIFFTMLILVSIILVAANTWGFAQREDRAEKRLAAQRLFQETQTLHPALTLDEYIGRLERVTALDRRFAEAFHELGRAYIRQATILGRERALAALERAVQLAPQNTEYRYTLAQLHLQRGAHVTAKSEFRRIIKIDPLDARPYYQLALFYEEDLLHYRDMISPHADATIYFYPFAEKDFAAAERLLRSAIGLDPKMSAAYHRLAGLYFDARLFDKMTALLEKAAAKVESAELFLFLGLARQHNGDPDAALQAYQQALALMSPADRALFYSLQTVLAPDSLKIYENAADSAQAHMQKRFWKARDPLFLTAANERLLEHFGRIAYANLRYSFPEKNIAGWKTDRGRALIRFGQPQSRTRTRADLGTSATGHVTLEAAKEYWNYGDFQMIFDDRFLNRQYSFAWGSVGEVDGKAIFEEKIRLMPERYEFPHGGRPLELPRVIAQFRAAAHSADAPQNGDDSTRLEIYYAVSDSTLATRTNLTLRRGLFFFDENWNEIQQWREDRHLAATNSIELRDRWSVRLAPGTYHVGLEVLDPASGRSGVAREKLVVENYAVPQLAMSSVVLARADSAHPALTLHHENGIHLVPALTAEFFAGEALYVYYEIYHLAFDADGRSRFRLDYTIAPETEARAVVSRALIRLGKMFGLNRPGARIGSSFETTGERQEEKFCHGLELLGPPAGHYRLTIRLTDRVSNHTVERTVNLQITQKKENKD